MKNVDPYKYQQQQDKKNKEAINVAALVKVTGFDPDKMTVDVQPLSKHLENGNYQNQPPVLGVPVAATKSGGFIVRPWIQVGDIGLVVYIDHDIDKVVSEGKEVEPNTERNHSTSDAVFVGGIVTGNAPVSGLPGDAVVIASDDGATVLEVSKGAIKLTAPSVEITASGNITMSAAAINLN